MPRSGWPSWTTTAADMAFVSGPPVSAPQLEPTKGRAKAPSATVNRARTGSGGASLAAEGS